MKVVISCTNREKSKTFVVAQKVFQIAQEQGSSVLINLRFTPLSQVKKPYESFDNIQKDIDLLNSSDGTILVFPEYNGSYPGFFKYFLDHWHEKKSFVGKPFCLVVIGSGIGVGTQALNHIQSILLHRRAYVFPKCIQIKAALVENEEIKDKKIIHLIQDQIKDFFVFSQKLKNE